jgi:hypothetical protein
VFVASGKNQRILVGDFRLANKIVRCVDCDDEIVALKLLNNGNLFIYLFISLFIYLFTFFNIIIYLFTSFFIYFI